METKDKTRPMIWQYALLYSLVYALLTLSPRVLPPEMGLYATVAVHAVFFTMTLIYIKLTGGKIKEVIRIRRPEGRKLWGTAVIFMGTYPLMLAGMLLIAHFYPDAVFETVDGLRTAILTGVPPVIGFLIIAVMPALTEESLCRAAAAYSMKGVREWIIVIVSAALFAVLHRDPVRFLPTFLMGAALALVYLRTENLIYPMLVHFINNSFSAVSLFSMSASDLIEEEFLTESMSLSIPLMSVGVYFIFCAASPFLIRAGLKLLRPKEMMVYALPGVGGTGIKKKDPTMIAAIVVAVIFAVSGIAMINIDPRMNSDILNVTGTYTVEPSRTEACTVEFSVDTSSAYALAYDVTVSRGIGSLVITDEEGTELGRVDFASQSTSVIPMMLDEGTYFLTVETHTEDVWEYCEKAGLPYTKEADLIVLGMNADPDEPVEVTVNFQIK